jgi:hypothetical protein
VEALQGPLAVFLDGHVPEDDHRLAVAVVLVGDRRRVEVVHRHGTAPVRPRRGVLLVSGRGPQEAGQQVVHRRPDRVRHPEQRGRGRVGVDDPVGLVEHDDRVLDLL